jgi:PAS domain S-box-containing protein
VTPNSKTRDLDEINIGLHHSRKPALQERGQEKEVTAGGTSIESCAYKAASVCGSELRLSPRIKNDVVMVEQTRRHMNAMIKFTKIMWMEDMQQLLDIEQGATAFMSFLQREYSWERREARTMLHFVIEARKLGSKAPPHGKSEGGWISPLAAAGRNVRNVRIAEKLCKQYLSTGARNEVVQKGGAALELVRQELKHTLQDLLRDAFPRFLDSEGCDKLMERLQHDKALAVVDSTVWWSDYTIAEDVGYWIKMFISMAETFPVCIVIVDVMIPDNPMFYVNDQFCKTTGYSKNEAQGQNCRFLQGPETEPESVEVIRETLRQGIDCHVKITNYKKSGAKFQNLLSMRPVHDSNGVYRFVVGVQFEVGNWRTGLDTQVQTLELKERLKTLEHLLRLLPTTLEVPEHQGVHADYFARFLPPSKTYVVDGQKLQGNAASNMAARLEQALDGAKMKTIDAVNQAVGSQPASPVTPSRFLWVERAASR